MTENEAIELIEKDLKLHSKDLSSKYKNGLRMAIQALEKQIPKKIIYEKQRYGTPYRCAECEADQTPIEFFAEDGSEPEEKFAWCWRCGQKLDWSDEE